MATGFKHLTVTEYYITFAIDNWDDVPKYMEVLIKLPNVPQELEDLVTGKKTEVLVSSQRMEEITTWLQHNWPKAPFEVEPWSWDLLEQDDNKYLIVVKVPKESLRCFIRDLLDRTPKKECDHNNMYTTQGYVRCPICNKVLDVLVNRHAIRISGCKHIKKWTYDNEELMITFMKSSNE